MRLKIGVLDKGARNLITDVPGVTVGHATVDTAMHKTGVTVIVPTQDDIFKRKAVAASYVLNGFGKSQGLIQIDELGTLETPIALTNTLNVGLVHDAMVEYMMLSAEKQGYKISSVNPIVCECNDARLNDIRHRAVTAEHVFAAFDAAGETFEEGCVGAGRGTSCHGFKAGIGSSSRVITIDGKQYTVGVLAQTNHGSMADFMVDGRNLGREAAKKLEDYECDKGSCIGILATDLPVSDRQLRRILRRMPVGMARLGAFVGHGSGEVFVGFSTANRISEDTFNDLHVLNDDKLDITFHAAAEAMEEAVLKAMLNAVDTTGYNGYTRYAATKFIDFSDLIES